MKYSDDFILTHDIDCFFFFGKTPCFAATVGGRLLDPINDSKYLLGCQEKILSLDDVYSEQEIKVNESYIHERYQNQLELINLVKESKSEDDKSIDIYFEENLTYEKFRDSYLSSFMRMSKKGFYSFIRNYDLEDWYRDEYVLICHPKDIGRDLIDSRDFVNLQFNSYNYYIYPDYNKYRGFQIYYDRFKY